MVVNSGGLLVFRRRILLAGAWWGFLRRFLIPFTEPVIDPFSSFFHHLFFGAFLCPKTNSGSRKPNVAKGSRIFIELYVGRCSPESCPWILLSFHENQMITVPFDHHAPRICSFPDYSIIEWILVSRYSP